MSFTGATGMIRALRANGKRLRRNIDKGVRIEGKAVLKLSKANAPRDKGDLRKSGYVTPIGHNTNGDTIVIVGFTAIHSLPIHEHPSQHDPPPWRGKVVNFKVGGPKFEERAMRTLSSGMSGRVGAIVKTQ